MGSIGDIGLLHPPIVDSDGRLIDGERRIRAALLLGWESIEVRTVSVHSLVTAEHDANAFAKQWTVSERVAIARAIEEELAGRLGINQHSGGSGNISLPSEVGQSRDIAADDAVLFLWVTSPILEESFALIKAWGFKYKASFVWDKEKHNMGHYNSVRHEFLLVCTRGSCQPGARDEG